MGLLPEPPQHARRRTPDRAGHTHFTFIQIQEGAFGRLWDFEPVQIRHTHSNARPHSRSRKPEQETSVDGDFYRRGGLVGSVFGEWPVDSPGPAREVADPDLWACRIAIHCTGDRQDRTGAIADSDSWDGKDESCDFAIITITTTIECGRYASAWAGQ